MKLHKDIQRLAAEAGFDFAKQIGRWGDYVVYRLEMRDRLRRTGVPVMVLEDPTGDSRYADVGEAFEIYDALYV